MVSVTFTSTGTSNSKHSTRHTKGRHVVASCVIARQVIIQHLVITSFPVEQKLLIVLQCQDQVRYDKTAGAE
jgi:hypothetical protein